LPRPRLEREDVIALVEETLQFVAAEFRQSGIELKLAPEGDIPPAMLDEAQIRQALLNLLRNAREALEAHPGDRRRVRIGLVAVRGGVEIALSDSGPGIRADVRAHLFELFFTTKERGSGLGLPLTREIVRAHGGTIDVTDARPEEGGGAKFVIWLPASPAQSSAPATGGTLDAA
jgi:signal transduction histidine kinase